MKLARILIAASSGMKSHFASRASIVSVAPFTRRTSKPMSAIVSRMIVTSLIFGTLCSVTGASVRAAAAMSLSTAFLAPAIRTSPWSGAPPSITNFCI